MIDISNHPENYFFVLQVEDKPEQIPGLRSAVEWVLHTLYDFPKKYVVWQLARAKSEAIDALEEAATNRENRGFDLMLFDLKIPDVHGGSYDLSEHGFAVLRKASEYSWSGPRIVISTFAETAEELEVKARADDLIVTDWLLKEKVTDRDYLRAKLCRHAVPVDWLAAKLELHPEPLVFRSVLMKRLLRDVIFLARRDYASWPLAKMLLLGEPGSGKQALCEAFLRFLPSPPRPVVHYNCATAVDIGHGGRIRLFGALGFQGMDPQMGVFEKASCYKDSAIDKKSKLAKPRAKPIIERAGVVFLDETAELKPELQASILNAIETGRILREGGDSEVEIACHVIFATNQRPDALRGSPEEVRAGKTRLREDLYDRIPNVMRVPPLSERPEEIVPIVRALAKARLRAYGMNAEGVRISAATCQLIEKAVEEGIVTSVRQLKAVADVLPGETEITDSNLKSVFARAEIVQKADRLRVVLLEGQSEESVYLAEAIERLQLGGLEGEIPERTTQVVRHLVKRGKGSRVALGDFKARGCDFCLRLAMLTEVMPSDVYQRVFSSSPEYIRKWRQRCYKDYGGFVELPIYGQDRKTRQLRMEKIIGLLLTEDNLCKKGRAENEVP